MALCTALLFRALLGVAMCSGMMLLPLEDEVRTVTVPRLVVDLDVAPEHRWTNVTKYWRQVERWEPPDQRFAELWPRRSRTLTEYLQIVKSQVDDEYLREIRGIVQEAATPDVTEDSVLITSMGYALLTVNTKTHDLEICLSRLRGCSALLAAMPNGTVVQGRNLDLQHGKDMTSKTAEVIFMRDGKPLYSSVVWPKQIFPSTAIRFGGWAFQQNTRRNMTKMPLNLEAMRKGGQDYALVARRLLETVDNFDAAVEALSKTKFAAPMYFVLSGAKPWQGAVVTVDRVDDPHSFTAEVRFLRQDTPGGWHIVQTNDDYNREAEDSRRPGEEAALLAFSQEQVSPDWVMARMTKGVLFTNITLFTSVYIPATGYDKTVTHVGNGLAPMRELTCNMRKEDLY